MTSKTRRLPTATVEDKIVAATIFVHYLLFSIIFFFWYDSLPRSVVHLVTGWKSLYPVAIFLYAMGADREVLKRRPALMAYILCFSALLALSGVATLFAPTATSSMFDWFKLVPRLLFFVAVVMLFIRRPAILILVLKLIVGWCVAAVIQYILLYLTAGFRFPTLFPGLLATFAGPFGLLGNVTADLQLSVLPVPIVRLCGYWTEPSTASGALFFGFFCGRFLHGIGAGRNWRHAATTCLVGGFLCLSNAGYAAIAVALAYGALISQRTHAVYRLALLVFAMLFVTVGLFGRKFVIRNMPDNEFAKAIVGVRADLEETSADAYDVTAGRLGLAMDAVASIRQHPIGVGVYTAPSDGKNTLSASAPIVWFTYAGVGGIVLLFTREAFLFGVALRESRRSLFNRLLAQAWIVVAVQQLSYGIWMDPIYMIISAAVLAGVPMSDQRILPVRSAQSGSILRLRRGTLRAEGEASQTANA